MGTDQQDWGKIGQTRLGQIVLGLIGLGLCFRLAYLDQKVFWVDEVATAIRIAGQTRTELTATLSDGQLRLPADLLAYQHSPVPALPQTLAALRQSPEHAPLYFLLLRVWAGLFGSSVVALRSFSVLCSLLLIGVLGWLGFDLGRELGQELNPRHHLPEPDQGQGRLRAELSGAQVTASLAAGLTALSPLLIAYGQEARPYSLWLLLLALNSGLLLRALRSNRLGHWLLYGLTLTLSFYTSLLSAGVAGGQMLYVWLVWPQHRRRLGWGLLGASAALLPWLGLIGQNWQTLQQNTTWMRLPLGGLAKLATWFYTVAILYFDVPVVTQPIWIAVATLLCATAVVAVIGLAFYRVLKITSKATWLFILTLAFSLPIGLIGLDLVINGRYSTAPRYWLPFHLGAQLAVALLLAATWNQIGPQPWEKPGLRNSGLSAMLAGFLVAVCLLSNLLHLGTSPRYLKTRNLNNPAVAEAVNQTVVNQTVVNQAVVNQAVVNQTAIHQTGPPLLLTESQNTMDMLSLSHHLNPQTQIQILPQPALFDQLQQVNVCDQPVFLFNPSLELQQQMQSSFSLTPAYQPSLLFPGEFALSLWRLACP